jgi:iron complex transport system ATP-binding protein
MSGPALETALSAFEWNDLEVRQDSAFTLRLPAGKIVAGSFTFIVGRNGSGKSTFLKTLARQNDNSARIVGQLDCFGKSIGVWKQSAFAKQVSFLPQDRSAHQPDLLAAEIVRLGRFAHGYTPDDDSIVADCLAEVDALHLADRPLSELSGGERQRVWIAMALAQKAQAILLDEPTTFLDWQHQLDLVALLQRLNSRRGVTVVAVIHDLNLALSVNADWLVLQNGALVYHGEAARFISEWDLAETFGVPAQLLQHQGRRILIPNTTAMTTTLEAPRTEAPVLRCPVKAPAANGTSSLFVDKAAAELVGSEKNLGDPAADAMLADTRAQIYYWPENFGGYCGHISVREGTKTYTNGMHIQGSRRYSVDLPDFPDNKWLKYQVEELIAHREATSVSHIASKAGVVFGDVDAVYGQKVTFVGDKMNSFYRLKDGKITQIGRSYGKVYFVINIDEHANCGGRFAAQNYTVFYFESATNRLTKTETYLDRYQHFGGNVWLPVERRWSEATDAGLKTRQILFTDLHVISPAAV